MTPRGGKREGAGRPPKGAERGKPVTFWLPPDLAAWLDERAQARGPRARSQVLVEALEALRAAPGTPTAEAPTRDTARELLDRIEAAAKAPLPTARWGLHPLPGALADRAIARGLDDDPRDALARVLAAGIVALEEAERLGRDDGRHDQGGDDR